MAFRTSMKDIMLKKFFNGILALFATSTVAAQTEPLKVLFIGNSYTHMNNMPKMFEKISTDAGMNVIVEKSAQSSATFKIHAEERPEVYEAIKSRKWDYVILQGFSREVAFEPSHLDSSAVPYIDKITKAIYKNNPSTNLMFYMTWGYKNGYGHLEEVNTYDKMTDKIEKGYSYLGEYYNVPVVPVGLVWQNLRKNHQNINLYARDLAHPSKKGSYLVASTFFQSIFGEKAGTENRIIRKHIAKQISNSTTNVLSETLKKYKLDRFFIDLDTKTIEDELGNLRYQLTYTINPSNVKSALLRAEGDETVEGMTGTYQFSEKGEHWIKFDLTNHSDEVSSHIRRIYFKGIVPKRREEEEGN